MTTILTINADALRAMMRFAAASRDNSAFAGNLYFDHHPAGGVAIVAQDASKIGVWHDAQAKLNSGAFALKVGRFPLANPVPSTGGENHEVAVLSRDAEMSPINCSFDSPEVRRALERSVSLAEGSILPALFLNGQFDAVPLPTHGPRLWKFAFPTGTAQLAAPLVADASSQPLWTSISQEGLIALTPFRAGCSMFADARQDEPRYVSATPATQEVLPRSSGTSDVLVTLTSVPQFSDVLFSRASAVIEEEVVDAVRRQINGLRKRPLLELVGV